MRSREHAGREDAAGRARRQGGRGLARANRGCTRRQHLDPSKASSGLCNGLGAAVWKSSVAGEMTELGDAGGKARRPIEVAKYLASPMEVGAHGQRNRLL
jgi:hypothetical protein